MNSLISSVLAPLGLAPAGHARRLKAESERSAEKLRALEGRMTELKADAEGWKRRYEEGSRKLAEAQAAVTRAEAKAGREEARAQELKSRGDALAAEMKEMRARLQDAGRTSGTVREHLMATETKLDLIEAALQVLDARTRAAAAPQHADKPRP
jgi:chromosome segregation ATPase